MDPESIQGDQHTGAAHLYVKETLEMLACHSVDCIAITRLDDIGKKKCQEVVTEESRVRLFRIQIGEINKQPKEYLWRRKDESKERIIAILNEYQFVPDVIHAVYWYSGNVALDLMKDYPKAKLLYTIVSLGKVKHKWKYSPVTPLSEHDLCREQIEYDLFQKASLIAAVSAQEKNNTIALYGASESKIYIIGRGVDSRLFSCPSFSSSTHNSLSLSFPPVDDDCRVLLFVGRIIESKGVDFLLSVYECLLSDPTMVAPPLWFIGGTKQEVETAKKLLNGRALLEQASRQGRIMWWGALPRRFLPCIYQRALVTCVPSYYEPGARVILESMSCGTPVIMTPTGYSHELVRPLYGTCESSFENGYVAGAGDVNTWSFYIKSLIRDNVWRDTLSKRAFLSVQPYYSLEQFAARHWQLYRALIEGTTPAIPSIDFDEARRVATHWQPPYELKDDIILSELDQDVLDIINPKGLPYQIKVINGMGGSSRLYRISVGEKDFILKQYLDKSHFFARYFPFSVKSKLRYATTRYNYVSSLKPLFSDRFFLPVLYGNKDKCTLLYPFARSVKRDEWDDDLIELAISEVIGFHQRQRRSSAFNHLKESVKSVSLSVPVSWDSLSSAYDSLFKANSVFRNGGEWLTPVRLDIEISLIRKSLADNVWNFDENMLTQLQMETSRLENEESDSINVIWCECRPEHFMMDSNNELKAIDIETVSIGEEEYDYASFFFWRLNPLELEPGAVSLQREKSRIARLFPKNSKRIGSWIWVLCLHWYLRDRSRGYYYRLERFRTIMSAFVK
jgi:glycosyltransferase involved in cell wall biosynthesis